MGKIINKNKDKNKKNVEKELFNVDSLIDDNLKPWGELEIIEDKHIIERINSLTLNSLSKKPKQVLFKYITKKDFVDFQILKKNEKGRYELKVTLRLNSYNDKSLELIAIELLNKNILVLYFKQNSDKYFSYKLNLKEIAEININNRVIDLRNVSI